MTAPNASTALASVIVDELAVCGVEVVVLSPGSRSGALAIAAAEHPDVEIRVLIDERSAAFHALGVARASERPVAVVATSGTAPANHFPAVVEADSACVPLIVVSADRPAEMRGVGANQTIDQMELFGNKVRAFSVIEAPEPAIDGNVTWRETVRRLVGVATGPFPGPVHLDVAFREPTVPVSDDGRTRSDPYPYRSPRIGGPLHRVLAGSDDMPELENGRGLVIAGDGVYDRPALLEAARSAHWPVFATALSGLRGQGTLSNYRRVLSGGVPDHLVPDVVVGIGSIGPDPSLETLFASGRQRLRIDRWGRHIDPGRNATAVVRGDPVQLIRSASATGVEWLDSWSDADRDGAEQRRQMVADDRLTGGLVAVTLNNVAWDALVVASSLPIREVDAHLERSGPVFANRGVSGIDGFVSTALGVATTIPRTLAYSGDLSMLHDANGFLIDRAIDLTMVVVDNGGGGLFDSLPQRIHAPQFERLFIADPNRDLETLARFHGARVVTVHDAASLHEALSEGLTRPGLDVVVAPVDRTYDLERRAQLDG